MQLAANSDESVNDILVLEIILVLVSFFQQSFLYYSVLVK